MGKRETTACEEATGYLTDDLESVLAQGLKMATQPQQLRLTRGPLRNVDFEQNCPFCSRQSYSVHMYVKLAHTLVGSTHLNHSYLSERLHRHDCGIPQEGRKRRLLCHLTGVFDGSGQNQGCS